MLLLLLALHLTPDSLHFQRAIPVVATFATGDNLSNTYIINQENAVEKYDSTGRRTGAYSNNRLGIATFLDASNPLKLLVWYPDFQTVVLLDRTLTEMGRINFSGLGYTSVQAVAMAFDGNIWIFDDAASQAVKIGLDRTVLRESRPINAALSTRFSANRIRDNGQVAYLNDPQNGLCILDQYANLETAVNSVKTNDLEVNGAWLIFPEADALCLRNQAFFVQQRLPLPKTFDQLWPGKNEVYIQRGGRLEIYGF